MCDTNQNKKMKKVSVDNQSENYFNSKKLIEAAGELCLIQFKDKNLQPTPINRPTLEITKVFFDTLNSGESVILLQWPFNQRDITIIHSIAMLSTFFPNEIIESNNYSYCKPLKSFRTLFFPWFSSRTRAVQKSILLDRNKLLEWNQKHLTRIHATKEGTNGKIEKTIDKFHNTISHLIHLDKLKDTHLAHPTLAEIYPMFRLDVDDKTLKSNPIEDREIFDRIEHAASLEKLTDYRPDITDPADAPFGFFAAPVYYEPRRLISAEPLKFNPPDICLLDLNSAAMNRLGPEWYKIMYEFIKACLKKYPKMPFFGLTNSTFHQNKVFEILSNFKGVKCPRKSVIVRLSSDPISEDPAIGDLTNINSQFKVVSGDLSHSVNALADAAKSIKSAIFAEKLRFKIGNIRKAASLPCGLSNANDILISTYGQSEAESFLENISAKTVLGHISEVINSEISGNQREKVTNAHKSVESLYSKLAHETPLGLLLHRVMTEIVMKHDRTIVVFNSVYTQRIGMNRLQSDPDIGKKILQLCDSEQLKFSNDQDFLEILREISKSPQCDEWSRIIVIAPSLKWLSKIIIEPWLPSNFIVLCEKYFALNCYREYENLSKFRGLAENSMLINRFESICSAAKIEAYVRDSHILEIEVESNKNLKSSDNIIDLTDDDEDNESEIIEFNLESKRILKVRPTSKMIRVNQHNIINNFEKVNAREIKINDIIVVPDEFFISQARSLLPIQVMSKNWVNIYHSIIESKIPFIKGNNISEKARYLLEKIQPKGASTKSEAAVKDWLNFEKHMNESPEVRRAHAPQNWPTFSAFLSELDIDEDYAEKIWEIGIQPFRNDRRQAGQKMASAFLSILVDPEGTTFGLDKNIRENILDFQSKAHEYTEVVVNIPK